MELVLYDIYYSLEGHQRAAQKRVGKHAEFIRNKVQAIRAKTGSFFIGSRVVGRWAVYGYPASRNLI